MKVCYVAHMSVSLAGGELSLLSLMDNIRKYGVEPILVCDEECKLVEKTRELGIPTKVLKLKNYTYQKRSLTLKSYIKHPIKRIYNYMKHKKMKQFLLDEKVDIVHLNSSVVCHEWAWVALKCNIPYVWHLREFKDLDHSAVTIGEKYFKHLMVNANKRIAITESIKDYWTKQLGCSCNVVYNGLDINKYYLEKNILNNEKIYCAIIGRVVAGKGQLEAVRAIKTLIDKGKNNYHLTIVGFRTNGLGPYEKEIMEYIETNGLSKYIDLVDYTSDISMIHKKHDIGLVCSKAEAFGRVTIEYMLAGMLVIGTNTGGTPELIQNAQTGLLYQQGDYNSLVDQLDWVSNNRLEAQKIATQSQSYAKNRFSIDNTVRGVLEIYSNI